MKKLRWTTLAALWALSSCVSEVELTSRTPVGTRTVVFSESIDEYTQTRAMDDHPIENRPDTGDGIDEGLIPVGHSFGVYAWRHYEEDGDPQIEPYSPFDDEADNAVTRGGEDTAPTYSYGDPAAWPEQGELSFLAYYPHTEDDGVADEDFSDAGGVLGVMPGEDEATLTLSYTVPTDGAQHIDVMYARQAEMTSGDGDPEGTVALVFRHALARMQFSARVEDFGGRAVRVTGIALKGAKRSGTLALDNESADLPEWTLSGTTDTPLTVNDDHLLTDRVLTGSMQSVITRTDIDNPDEEGAGDLIVIPQPTAGLSLEITATVDGAPLDEPYSIPLAAAPDMDMNMIYNFGVTLTPQAATLQVAVRPWDEGYEGDYEFEDYYLYVNKSLFEFEADSGADILTITTDHPDKWVIADIQGNTDNWLTITPQADNGANPSVALTVETNETYLLREATFNVRAGNMKKKIHVVQKPAPAFVYAAPGMPGIKRSAYNWLTAQRKTRGSNWIPRGADWSAYKAVHGEPLTIRGSSTYGTQGLDPDEYPFIRGIDVAGDGTLDGLETEPVYTLYFKWGSMIAMVGSANDEGWSVDDVVWVNHDFAGTITDKTGAASSDGAYGDFFAASNDGVSSIPQPGVNNFDFSGDSRTKGQGDICMEITGGEWFIPTGLPWTSPTPYSGTTTPFGTTPANWALAQSTYGAKTGWTTAVNIGLPDGGGAISNNSDLFLPAAGSRYTRVSLQRTHGWYWSSSAMGSAGNYTNSYELAFSGSDVSPNNNSGRANGMAVRCVTAPTFEISPASAEFDYYSIPHSGFLGYQIDDQNVDQPAQITVTANNPWTATVSAGDEDWLQVSTDFSAVGASLTGTGDGTFYLYPRSNYPGPEDKRTGTVTITSLGLTRTVTVTQYRLWGGGDDLLFFAAGNRLAIGKWDPDGSRGVPAAQRITSVEQLAYFQFGSVIGFDAVSTAWDAQSSAIRFNPTANTYTGANATAAFQSIPNYGSSHGLGNIGTPYMESSRSVSSPQYHNDTNLRAGKGDPCKLVGLTSAEAKALADANQLDTYTGNNGWRLPTQRENVSFVGGPMTHSVMYPQTPGGASYPLGTNNWLVWPFHEVSAPGQEYTYTNSTYPAAFGDYSTTFDDPTVIRLPVVANYNAVNSQILPAAGWRDEVTGNLSTGYTQDTETWVYHTWGFYWSSSPFDASANKKGFGMQFYYEKMQSVSTVHTFSGGYAIRCVRDLDNPKNQDEE